MVILSVVLGIMLFVDFLWLTRDNQYSGAYIGNANGAVISVNKNHTFISSDGYRGKWFFKDGVIVFNYKTTVNGEEKEYSEEMIVIPSGGVLNNQYFTRKR
jgi:hypothetical protein